MSRIDRYRTDCHPCPSFPRARPIVLPAPLAILFALLLTVLVSALPGGSSPARAEASDANPLALKGLDPVHLVQGEEVEGSEEQEVSHRGYRYRFASAETRAAFDEEPGRFRIQNETCPVYPGATLDPSLFVVHEERIYAFATEKCVEEFQANPSSFLEGSGQEGDADSRERE